MPPKKAKKVNLAEFLADGAGTGGGSWADEMDDLPTGPSGNPIDNQGLGGSHLSRGLGGPGGRYGDDSFGESRAARPEVPFPTQPPYTAFVGNLTFETVEADLRDFFHGLEIVSVRLVSGQDGKPKGFGYCEFAKADDLRNALSATGQALNDRPTRISVAEAPSQQIGRADAESTWTRKGPLEALPGRSGGFGGAPRSGGFESGGSAGFGAGREEVEREGPIRGGRFQPSAPAPVGRTGGGGFSGGERREFQPAREVEVEREGPIRGGKFQPTPEREQRSGGFGFGAGGERRSGPPGGPEPSRSDEGTWTRTGPLPPREREQQTRSSFGDRTPPVERRPLQLAARTSSSGATSPSGTAPTSPAATPAASNKPSPFGAAKPVDNAQREREIEAKLAREREAAQAKLAEAKKEKERSTAEGGDKVAAAAAGVKPAAEERAWRAPREAGKTSSTAFANKSASTASNAATKKDKTPATTPATATATATRDQAAGNDDDESWTTVAKGAAVQAKDTVVDQAAKATKVVQDKFAALSTQDGDDDEE